MFAYCNNSPVCSTDENGCAQISLLDPRNITAEGGVPVPPWTLVGFILGLLGIGAIEQKPKTDTFEDSISIAEVAQEDDENDAVFWGVNFYGGTPNMITNEMNYDEAKLWAIGIAASGVYSSRVSWGLVTQKQQDALAMAIDLGGGPLYIMQQKVVVTYRIFIRFRNKSACSRLPVFMFGLENSKQEGLCHLHFSIGTIF